MKFILGKKLKMTQEYDHMANVVPVTILSVGPCTVTQVKTAKKDGYSAVQVGYGQKKTLTKSLRGHLKGLPQFRNLQEFKIDNNQTFERGQVFGVDSFIVGEKISVTGVSKAKGFQGVVKRHGFHGSPASHGHKDQLRMPGSIGAGGVQKVFKGTRMGGHMGNAQVTTKNLEIFKVDTENNLIYVIGAVPGNVGGLVSLQAKGEMVLKSANDVSEVVADKIEASEESAKQEVEEAPAPVEAEVVSVEDAPASNAEQVEESETK